MLTDVHRATRSPRLCLAGGCAMNSVANGKIREQTPFREVYIQPAAGDNGTALGAAYYVWHQTARRPRGFVMEHGYWGPEFADAAIRRRSTTRRDDNRRARLHAPQRAPTPRALDAWTAQLIADGNVVGWFQGRMEWGARALGNRSILADPRRADMRDMINTQDQVPREVPSVRAVGRSKRRSTSISSARSPIRSCSRCIRCAQDKRAVLPAITHVDGAGRLQTVSARTNPALLRLIKEFERLTGVPMRPQHELQRERADRATRRSRRSTASCARAWT